MSRLENPIQTNGFWMFGTFSLILAATKMTVAGHWSWWRVLLPALAFLGNNTLYMLAGFVCLFWLKHPESESEPAVVQKYSHERYSLAALIFFFLFLDNLLRRIEGTGWAGFWPCSGTVDTMVLFGTLSLVAHTLFWSRVVRGLNLEGT